MRILSGFSLALLVATGLFAQNQSGFINPIPVTRSFGSVVNPGGGSLPGVTRTTGSVLHPGGGTSQIAIPGTRLQNAPAGRVPRNIGGGGVYAYPVAVPMYVGDYSGTYLSGAPVAAAPAQPSQPNVIVVYPPAPQYAYPAPQPAYTEVPREQLQTREEQPEPAHYLLAFKDRSIYSAVAYWVDGDTIHYFTSGNTHNQASLALIDRDMTKRLNEGGLEVKLPTEK
jgi:hypothetical protein